MAKQLSEQPLTVSPAQAADLLGVSRALVMKLVSDGKLIDIRVGNRHLITYHSLKSFIGSRMLSCT